MLGECWYQINFIFHVVCLIKPLMQHWLIAIYFFPILSPQNDCALTTKDVGACFSQSMAFSAVFSRCICLPAVALAFAHCRLLLRLTGAGLNAWGIGFGLDSLYGAEMRN